MDCSSDPRVPPSVKRYQSLQSSHCHDWPLSVDDLEFEDESHGDYTCPFCYMELDITSFCAHVEEEHLYECNSAVCPICAAKVGRDLVGHINRQHGHVFKMQRRRRSRKFSNSSNSSNSTLSLLSKELPGVQLHTLLGGTRSSASTSFGAADPILSSFICNVPVSEPEDDASKARASDDEAVVKKPEHNPRCYEEEASSLTAEEREHKYREDVLRSKFSQQLLLSTIFSDD